MHEAGPGLGRHAEAGGLAGGEVRFAEGDPAAVAADVPHLGLGRPGRHHDVGGDTAQLRGAGQGGGVVARGVRDHAASGLGIREGKDGIAGPARLEGAGFLEVLALEEEPAAAGGVQSLAREHGRAFDERPDAFVGGADGGEVEGHAVCLWGGEP